MLIISKFHDYYDTASIYGIDKTCIYKREKQTIKVKEPISNWNDKDRWPYTETLECKFGRYEARKLILGFCGELYPLIHIEKHCEKENFYFYDQESVSEFLLSKEISEKQRYWTSDRDFRVTYPRGMSRFFDQNTWTKLEKKFYEHNTPVFLHGRIDSQKLETHLNVCLKDLRFMTIKDPQTAFQEVYVYLSGVLGAPLPPKEKIDDKVMAASRGHDGEYSFRKPPGKRGKKQWR